MLNWKYINSLPLAKLCKGSILSARIYADTTGNKCGCGGAFTKRIEHSDHVGLMVPKCGQCNQYPPLFHIDADAKDPNGAPIRVKIRNDQNNLRLENISQVIYTLQNIQREIMEGEFDVSRYVSKDARETFRFKNYVLVYLKKQEKRLLRGEITPKALRDKKSLINNHLIPEFGALDLIKITRQVVALYLEELPERKRVHDLAVGELKTIMNQAERDGKIKVAPKFDKVPKAKRRTEIISAENMLKTIDAVEIQLYKDMLTLMSMYPFRPSEIRALRWKDLDFVKNKINVVGHFSDEVWISGRKSISEGAMAHAEYDIVDRSRRIFNEYRARAVRQIDPETDWVFKGVNGTHVQDEALSDAWRTARKIAGHTHQLYEIRHRCLTDFAKRVKGDIVKMQKFSHHRSANTLMERYIRDDSDLSEFIQ